MSDKYEKIDQIEHIHLRPDMYVGSLKPKKFNNEWISNSKHTKITKTNSLNTPMVSFVSLLKNVFLIAIDNVWRWRH